MLEAGSKRIVENSRPDSGYDVSRVIIVENGNTTQTADRISKLKAFLRAQEPTHSFVDNAFNKSSISINNQEVKLPGGLCFPASILDEMACLAALRAVSSCGCGLSGLRE